MPMLVTHPRRLQPRGYYAPGQSLNGASSLTRGLIAWFRCVPRLMRGTAWYDLVSGQRGTLTAMADSSGVSGWNSTTRPGGHGELRFDGSDDYVSVPDTAFFTFTNGLSVSAWVNPAVAPTTGNKTYNILGQWGAGGAGNAAWRTTLKNLGTFTLSLDTYDGVGVSTVTASTAIPVNQWLQTIWVYTGGTSGTNAFLYSNGVLLASGTITNPPQNSLYFVGIGSVAAIGADNLYNGALDDILVFNRGLAPAEIAWMYASSQRGYPDVLRRFPLRSRFYSFGAGSTTLVLLPFALATSLQRLTLASRLTAPAVRVATSLAAPVMHSRLLAPPGRLALQLARADMASRVLVPSARVALQLTAPTVRSVLVCAPTRLALTLTPLALHSRLVMPPARVALTLATPAVRSTLLLTPVQMATLLAPVSLPRMLLLGSIQTVLTMGQMSAIIGVTTAGVLPVPAILLRLESPGQVNLMMLRACSAILLQEGR